MSNPEFFKSPLVAHLAKVTANLAENQKLDPKDLDSVIRLCELMVPSVICAIEEGRITCKDSEAAMSINLLLVAALQVIYDGHFVETFAEEARP
jgi:hypothetical protein